MSRHARTTSTVPDIPDRNMSYPSQASRSLKARGEVPGPRRAGAILIAGNLNSASTLHPYSTLGRGSRSANPTLPATANPEP